MKSHWVWGDGAKRSHSQQPKELRAPGWLRILRLGTPSPSSALGPQGSKEDHGEALGPSAKWLSCLYQSSLKLRFYCLKSIEKA